MQQASGIVLICVVIVGLCSIMTQIKMMGCQVEDYLSGMVTYFM